MTMFQRKRIRLIKEEMERRHAVADSAADNLLDKLKSSKWTAAILAAAIAAIVFFWSFF